MAATYPLDVVEASHWLQDPRNASTGDQLIAALQRQNWDPSVKLLAPFPSILRMMDAKLEFERAERLGEAFLADPKAVMDAVRRGSPTGATRRQACFGPARNRANGAGGESAIEARTPKLIYVPVCDPSLIYGACGWESWPIFPLFSGLVVLDFRDHHIHIARNRFALMDRIVGRLAARSGGMTRSTGATSPIATRRSPPDMAQRRRVGRSPAVSTSLNWLASADRSAGRQTLSESEHVPRFES